MKNTRFATCFIFLLLSLFSSCKKETSAKETTLSENVAVKNDSVKRRTNRDSLDKANEAQLTPDEEYWNKISVQSRDSILWLHSQMRLDHRIFGYKKPTTKSERLIFLSIFTNDVEGNPFQCKYGSHYSTTLGEEKKLKYVSTKNDFVETVLLDHEQVIDTIYFERKWVEFEEKQ